MTEILIINPKGGAGKSTVALAFGRYLQPTKFVDMDPQATLSNALELANIPLCPPGARYTIYDSPPYNDVGLDRILKEADHIIVPARLGYSDVLSLRMLYERLLKTQTIDKAMLVYNAVRKPLTLEAKEVMSCFASNYPNIKIANTMISLLDTYRKLYRFKPLEEKASKQITSLLAEIGINVAFK